MLNFSRSINKHGWHRQFLNEMSNTYRGPSIDASYQVSVHLAKEFQRRRFLEIDQSETRTAYGGHIYGRSSVKNAQFFPIH
jgi:hypothetical protein